MKIIKAVAGVLSQDNKILMASRPLGKIFAGYWEFPGGKIEATEAANIALTRELKEEIGVVVNPLECEHITLIEEEYPHGVVHLEVMLIRKWDAEILPLENQRLHWQEINKICTLSPLLTTTQKILDLLNQNIIIC